MKAIFLGFVLLLPSFALAGEGADIQIGDPRERVLDRLGDPVGRVVIRGREWMTYPRGQITLTEGRVTAVDLASEEEVRIGQEKAAQDREAREAAAVAARARRITEGTALLERARADEAFAGSPASTRLAYWQQFSRRFPEVDVSLELTTALGEMRRDEDVRREAAQAAAERHALQLRVADAEARAAEAERESRQRDRQVYLSTPYYNGGYPVGGYTCPPYAVVTPNRTHRPPIVFQIDGPVGNKPVAKPYSPVWVHPSSNNRRGVSVEIQQQGLNGKIVY